MSSAKGKLLRFLSGVALERAVVEAATDVGGFRRLTLRGTVPTFAAGAKVQLLLPSDDTRTYTPIRAQSGMLLLGWKHAGGPGAHWMSSVQPGDEIPYVGPQRSLELPRGPVVVLGDETSVAVAAAFEAERPGQVYAVIAASEVDPVRAAAGAVGLGRIDVVARGDSDGMVAKVVAHLASTPDAAVALTGSSTLVTPVRAALRAAGVKVAKTKAYWVPGRVGLD